MSFKGEVVGELDFEVLALTSSMIAEEESGLPVFQTEEPNLSKFIGEMLHLRFRVLQVKPYPLG